MWLFHYFKFAVASLLGLYYSLWVMIYLLLSFIKGPITFVTCFFKKRNVMPSCLNDPDLGSHGFIHIEMIISTWGFHQKSSNGAQFVLNENGADLTSSMAATVTNLKILSLRDNRDGSNTQQEVRLHYVAKGDEKKPLMLLLHGFPEFWYCWRYQLREFSKDYRVVAIDQRGYGDSDKPSGVKNYSIDKLTGDIKQLIPALGYSRCVLVGHDWGGSVSWHFAMRNPEMVQKLIILNSPHPVISASYQWSNWEQFRKSWYKMFFQVPILPEIAFWTNDFKLLELALLGKKGGVKSEKTTAADIEAYKYSFSSKGAVTNPLNYYRALFRYPLAEKNVRLIEKPTMIIWGCLDMALNKELAPLAGKFVPDLTIKYIEDASHWVQQDRPDEVNKYIWEFLNQ